MWKDKISDRYPWAKIKDHLDELIYELEKAADEEEVELSLLKLHLGNEIDMRFFTAREREKVKKLMAVLITDTDKHYVLLGEAVKELKTHHLEQDKETGQNEKTNQDAGGSI